MRPGALRKLLTAAAILACLLPQQQAQAEAWDSKKPEAAARMAMARWAALLAEVHGLPALERKALLLAVRGLVEIDSNRLVVPKLARGGAEALWALKVLSREQAHLSRLAADLGWPEIAAYFAREAADGARLVRGEIDLAAYRSLTAANARELSLIVMPYTADRNFVGHIMAHSDRARPLAAFIVHESKLFGSGQ